MFLLFFIAFIYIIIQIVAYNYFIRFNQKRLELLNHRSYWSTNYNINVKFQLVANLTVLKVYSSNTDLFNDMFLQYLKRIVMLICKISLWLKSMLRKTLFLKIEISKTFGLFRLLFRY